MLRRNWLFSLLLILPMLAHGNWSDDWTSRSKVAINPAGISGVVADVPVVIRLHSGNFNIDEAKPDGSDLRFIASDDKTELNYHIEKWDDVNALAVVWVNLPKLDPKDKAPFIWMYVGNEKATSTQNAKASFDANTNAVYHFAANAPLKDSISGQDATGTITTQKTALIGEAGIFAGNAVTIANAKPLTGAFTWSAWIKPTTLPQTANLITQGSASLKLDGQKLSFTTGSATIAGADLKPNEWQHVAVTVEAGKATLYVNGAAVGNGDAATNVADTTAKLGDGYTGELDEVALASAARSADWIKLAATGQGADSKLITIEAEGGDEEEGGTSYITILIESLTPDAKVVIAILAVMFAISAFVMVKKAILVSKTDKDNKRFLAQFQKASSNLLALDKTGTYKDSTLFTLYAAGLREIRKREHEGQALALSGASMDAIKAAIDADLVRQTQHQNAGMVLLTIAISGGPFLGLLGTVVGVMITFAAIAAAGDVNVNAIAPGIAAALLATVAGLGVAIPALFGYNYLASRIKNITIEMQIFVDEFITRVAELHGK